MSTIGILYANALVATPIAFALAVGTGEVGKIANFKYIDSGVFWFGFSVSCAMGFLLTYTSVLSTTYNSPLATSITGNAKDIATTAIGWLVFTGFKPTVASIGGILVSFFGAFCYSFVNLSKTIASKPNGNALGTSGSAVTASASAPNSDAAHSATHDSESGDPSGSDSGSGSMISSVASDAAAAERERAPLVSFAEWQATGGVNTDPSSLRPR